MSKLSDDFQVGKKTWWDKDRLTDPRLCWQHIWKVRAQKKAEKEINKLKVCKMEVEEKWVVSGCQ